METFLESILPVIIVAAFVGARIAFMLRRWRIRRQREENTGAAPSKAARNFASWEDEFRDAAAAGNAGDPARTAPGDEAFSAWNLSVDDGPPAQAAPERLPEPPRPLAAALTGLPEMPPPARFAAAPESAAPPRRPAPASPGRRFTGLSPLQRGVIWAEILGAPKGLQD
ncbi:MAG: hypothetical protein LBG14_07655 [Treponema sp.]|jgi:hypothetical protein|nr:hypothetical protein [Treponema sp.]